MKYFVDTEFIERGTRHPIELVSLAIVSEGGSEFYGKNIDANLRVASSWFKENVEPHLFSGHPGDWYQPSGLRDAVIAFVGSDPSPEFWGRCCDFDYVLVSQLIGFESWPKEWPYYFRDIQQTADERGINLDETDALPEDAHNALADALRIRELWNVLHEARTVATEG